MSPTVGIIAAFEETPTAPLPPDNAVFIAVGGTDGQDAPIVMTSEDGVTWVDRSAPASSAMSTAFLQDIAYNGSRWVAVGYDSDVFGTPVVMTSDNNGATWTARTPNPATNFMVNSICWTGTAFIAVGNDSASNDPRVMTSPDGVTWTARTSAPTTNTLWHGVSGISGLAIAVGSDGTAENSPKIMTSADDGASWTARTPATGNALRDVVCVAGKHIAVGFASSTTSRIMSSTAGTTWTNETGPSDYLFYGIAYLGALYVAVGSDFNTNMTPRIASSPTGTTWTARTPDPSSGGANGIELLSVAACSITGSTGFVAVGRDFNNFNTPYIMHSTNGTTWNARTPNPSSNCILIGVAGAH